MGFRLFLVGLAVLATTGCSNLVLSEQPLFANDIQAANGWAPRSFALSSTSGALCSRTETR
jgi:hypothetical protein